ncbi:MAG: iron-containing alcohol dehydrogenase [Spirochaetia bacterium]|jgi:alcohol dehydrogenase class IV|nr:iron-containing alcohol dehydrogenase [Spirochaetia bacterium]
MKLTLNTPVEIHEFDRLEARELFAIMAKSAGAAGEQAKSFRVAAVCDKTPIGGRDRVLESLGRLCGVTVFDRVEPNPRTVDIMAMLGQEDFGGFSAVLGIGGGSVLDSAKALAMLAANGGCLDDYLGASPSKTIAKPSLPLTLIPTTAGTGSEVTKVGVYTSKEGRKHTLGSPLMMARSAVLCGSLLDGIPPALCASTGFDALDHALESIWNKNADDATRQMAEDAAVEALAWLPLAYKNAALIKAGGSGVPENHNMVCMRMLRASCMAGTAFSITGTAAGHALSFVLSEDWHIAHGTACAFTLLDIFDLAAAEEKTAKSLGRIMKRFDPAQDARPVQALRNHIAAMMDDMRIPRTFKDLGIVLGPQEIAPHFDRAFSDPKMWNQIPRATKENIYPLLEKKC